MQADAHHEAAQADERLGELAKPDGRVVAAEAGIDDHLLAVVRPALDKRRRREEDRLARLRPHLPQVLVVQEVAGVDLVHRDRPQRAVAEVAQVLFLALGRPRGIHVGHVVVRPHRLRLERPGRPHAGERPPVEAGGRGHDDGFALGNRDQAVAADEVEQLLDLVARGRDELPFRRVLGLDAPPGVERVAAVEAAGLAAEALLRGAELAHGDVEQPVAARREPFLEAQLGLEPLAAEPERPARARRHLGFEVRDVPLERVGRVGGRVGQVREQPEVVEVRQRPRQIVLDETQGAAQRLETDLHEQARRLLDVVARRVEQPRRLPELGEHAPGALGDGRVREERLAREAGGQQLGIHLRAPLPGAKLLELVQPRANVVLDERALDALHRRQAGRVDRRKPPAEGAEVAHVLVDRAAAQVLEQVVVRVDAVKRGGRRMRLVQVRQVLVDEMGQRLGGIHLKWRGPGLRAGRRPGRVGRSLMVQCGPVSARLAF